MTRQGGSNLQLYCHLSTQNLNGILYLLLANSFELCDQNVLHVSFCIRHWECLLSRKKKHAKDLCYCSVQMSERLCKLHLLQVTIKSIAILLSMSVPVSHTHTARARTYAHTHNLLLHLQQYHGQDQWRWDKTQVEPTSCLYLS